MRNVLHPHRLLCLFAILQGAAAWAAPMLELQPGLARPGDAVLVTVRSVSGNVTGTMGERTLHFLPVAGGAQALTGLSVDVSSHPLAVAVKSEHGGSALEGSLEVRSPHFPSRELTVASKFIEPPASVKKKMAEDKEAFAVAFKQGLTPRQFSRNFAWPRRSVITAPYGDLRLFNGHKQSQHYGTDLDGRVGEPILAANDGTVVMARECYASGNTVLVHHGADLFTAYFHLSKFEVKPGDKVKQGDLLGKVGKTGRVTGPHLHWGAKIEGLWVDPESLLRLDFEKR